jgi:ELWxxDGT repeat protein
MRPKDHLRRTLLFALATATGLLPTSLGADGEYLVQDFGTAQQYEGVDLYAPFTVVADGVAYFYRHDGIHGQELWRSDGKAAGTYRLVDACPGLCGAEFLGGVVGRLAAVGSRVYFTADDGIHGTELWVTDGTARGTRMVRDIRPGPSSSRPSALGSFEGELYFGADDGIHGHELWRSDGTDAGTALVADLTPGTANSTVSAMEAGVGNLYVRATGRLYASDGTAAGTQLLHSHLVQPFVDVRGGSFEVLTDGTAVFGACTASGPDPDCELWSSDGTASGTVRIADLRPGPDSSYPTGFLSTGEQVWFTAHSPTPNGFGRIFRTDGTVGGTAEVPLPAEVRPEMRTSRAAVVGSHLFFTGWDEAFGNELWVTDGATTQRVADLNPGPASSIGTGWWFDRPNFVELGGSLLFVADDGQNGTRLWRSEGTAATTVPLSDFDAAPPDAWFGGYQAYATPPVVGGRVLLSLFRADRGLELWASDGTANGTERVRTLNDSTSGFLHPTEVLETFVEIRCQAPWRQGLLLTPLTGPGPAEGGWYYVDGVPDGAQLLTAWAVGVDGVGYPECASHEGQALAHLPSGSEHALWSTDGTASGTAILLPLAAETWIQSRPAFGTLRSAMFVAYGSDRVLRLERNAPPEEQARIVAAGRFASGEGELGQNLFFGGWSGLEVSDGVSEPTALIEPTQEYPEVDDLTMAGSTPFFTVRTEMDGTELWSSDGTVTGTGRVRDLRPGPDGGIPGREIGELLGQQAPESRIAAIDEARVVFPGDDGTTGFELWASDGTEAGTVVVADIAPGPDGSWPRHLVALGNGAVLFAAEHPKLGYELFRTDGTAAGTAMVRDLVVGSGSSVPDDFVVQDGVLYFSAWTPAHGREAWRSDGTFAGTWRLTDVAPGPLSSSPSRFVRRGNRLFFTATDHVHGFELWARADDGSIPLFIDGFETGDAGRWSAEIP